MADPADTDPNAAPPGGPPAPPPPIVLPAAAAGNAGNAAIAAALTSLAAAIAGFNAATAAAATGGGGGGTGGGTVQLDPIFQPAPFDLSSQAGSSAYNRACAKLDETWDGTVEKFPAFVIALRIRASEANWSAAAPQGILLVPSVTTPTKNHNILTEYHKITEADITAAYASRTDDRAKQNSTAMYRALKQSIDGDLNATIFQQISNLPTSEDGVGLWYTFTKFTVIASLQLSMVSFRQILEFDPALHNFNIPAINTQLNHLFLLATTRDRELGQPERIQHTLTAYARIRQPELWAQWVRNKFDAFDEGLLTDSQTFMNTAVLKYNKIVSECDGSFPGSSTTLQEDIVAMVASKRKASASSPAVAKTPKSNAPADTNSQRKSPPWLRHFKTSTDADATPYKVGDTKTWNNETWHFCDCPNHRGKARWHPHPYDQCRTRIRWMKSKEEQPAAHIATDDAPADDASSSQSTLSSATPPVATPTGNDLSALLASAFNLAGDNAIAKDFIADALTALADA